MKRPLLLFLAAIALVLTFGVQGALAFTGMELVSVSSGGVEGNNSSGASSVSADGRYIAFQSLATNLVSPDTSSSQIFVRDRQASTTTLVSAGPGGAYGDSNSYDPSISPDGRYIGFESPATNLVGPASSGNQVFVRDTQEGTTTLASVDANGVQGNGDSYNASSGNGYIAFQSNATNLVSPASSGNQIFVRDIQAGTTILVSENAGGDPCDGYSSDPSISPDGRYVSFESWSTNLVSPPTTSSYSQIFVHDRQTGDNWLASKGPGGSEGNANSEYSSISADGRYVTFHSVATNLVSPATSGTLQVFVYDRQSDNVTLVSVNTSGSEGGNISRFPSISADGRCIAFYSWVTDLVSPATSGVQVFVRDTQAGATMLISENASGVQGNNYSAFPSISGNGNFVAFNSGATNLVSPPTSSDQIFIAGGPYVPPPPATLTISATAGANGSISPAGSVIVNRGDSKTFTITANTGYHIADVLVDGGSAGAVASHTFTNVTENHTISASFSPTFIGGGTNLIGGSTQPRGAGSSGALASAQSPVMLPNIQVQSASLSASKVAPGEPVTVMAQVANTGAVNGTVRLTLFVNGQKESSQGVTVSSGNNMPVTFTVTRNEPGAYSVYVGGTLAGTFVVDQFSDTSIILYISGALILFAFVIGAIYTARRRQSGR